MFSSFKHYRIRYKLSVVITLASLLVLVLVCLSFGGIRFFELRRGKSDDLQGLLLVLNDRLAESLLKSNRMASERLLRSLRLRNSIGAVYLFDRNHVPFAESIDVDKLQLVESKIREDFAKGFPAQWRDLRDVAVRYDLTSLRLFAPIFYEQKYLGGLYLLADLKQHNRELVAMVLMLLVIGGVAVDFAWRMSGRLQRPISEPILELSGLTKTILQTRNYSLRGVKRANDEIGLLVDGFNNMLGQIEKRQQELVEHREVLEHRVAERTADLTQTVRALEEARQLAESANQAKSTFLANMTHELRTPLIGVLGMNELLIGTALDRNQKHFVAAVDRSGCELLEMIDQILEFSRIESGHLRLQTREVDLLRLVEEVIMLLAERVYHKGLDLIWRVEPRAMAVVVADAQRLKQILVNLMGNAIKFTAQGQVALEVRAVDDSFLFCVKDSGVGIAPEQQAQIFEAFRQADESVARAYGGTGLGLSIVKELTLLMGGELRLESRPAEGSCFEVRLPLPWVKPAQGGLPETLKGASLVLLEPADRVRLGLGQWLTDLGFCVDYFSSVEELLACSRTSGPFLPFYPQIILSSRLSDDEVLVLREKMGPMCRKILRLQKTLPASEARMAGVAEIYEPHLRQILMQDFTRSGDLDAQAAPSFATQGESA